MAATVQIAYVVDSSGAVKAAAKVDDALGKNAKSAEKASKTIDDMSGSTKSAADQMDKAGKMAVKLRGALGNVSPAAGEMAGAVDDAVDALEGLELAAGAVGGTALAALAIALAAGAATWASWTNAAEEAAGIGADFEERISASDSRIAALNTRIGEGAGGMAAWDKAIADANSQLAILGGETTPEAAAAARQLQTLHDGSASTIRDLNISIAEQSAQLQMLATAYENGEISAEEFTAKQTSLVAGINSANTTLDAYSAKMEEAKKAIEAAAKESERLRKAKEREAEAQRFVDAAVRRSIDARLAEIEALEDAQEAAIEAVQKAGEERHKAEMEAMEAAEQRMEEERARVDELVALREEEKQAALEVAEAEAEAAEMRVQAQQRAQQRIVSIAMGTASALVEAQLDAAKEGSAQEKRLMEFQKLLAIADITVSTAQGVGQILATYSAMPVLAASLSAATIAAGATQIGIVESTSSPSFHVGGVPTASMLGGEEGRATVLAGEMVVDRATTSAVGGPAGLRSMMGGGGGTVLRIGRREVREMVRTDTRSGGMIAQIGRRAAASSTPPGRSSRGTLA